MILQSMSRYQYFEVGITDVVAAAAAAADDDDDDDDDDADAATFHIHCFCFYNNRLILVCY